MTTAPQVSVVIPFFDQQEQLDLQLRALQQQQDAPAFEVVVADDGSTTPPAIPSGLGFPCAVVRQENRGFRAAAARNLGAAAATGSVLTFLDGDTLPTAGYLAAVLNTVVDTDDGHGVLVVGRRRHLGRGAGSDQDVLGLLRADDATVPAGLQVWAEPEWLAAGYRRTDDLRAAGPEDFRLVISAVLTVDRRLWAATGGFDEDFVGYGGEDWDFAWRAWTAGADLRHAPTAVAWHDGPDAAGRGVDLEVKNAESLRLAATVPLPSVRGTAFVHEVPAIAVRYLGATTGTAADAPVIDTVAGWLQDSDAAVWFPHCPRSDDLPPVLRDDPRVHHGEVPATIAARTVHAVDLHRPLRLPGSATGFCAAGDRRVVDWLTVRSTRRRNRALAVPVVTAAEACLQPVPAGLSLERRWGGW